MCNFERSTVQRFNLSMRIHRFSALVVPAALALLGCSGTTLPNAVRTPTVIQPASPPDDGSPSKGGARGNEHAAALEQLARAPIAARADRSHTFAIPLPDANHWTRVNYWGVRTAVGFRYGKSHHALVAAFLRAVDEKNDPRECIKEFEAWAKPFTDTFDMEVTFEPPRALAWNGKLVDLQPARAKTATLAARDTYSSVYAAYPAWPGHCLVVGVAVPGKDDEARSVAVRDRFIREVLPKVEVTSKEPPKEE